MADEVRSTLETGILEVSIHRPEQRNSMDAAVMAGLTTTLRQAAANPAVRVVTLTGSGDRVFCAGADLKSSQSQEPGAAGFTPRAYRELLLEILHFPKPTVALARGHVLAGGLGLVLACDFALACDDIYLSTPEILVGMFPMMVMALLVHHVGRKRAFEMAFLGERLPASMAMQFGIVNHVYARDHFETEAGRFVQKLVEKSAAIIRLGKEAMLHMEAPRLEADLMDLESALFKVLSCADSKEGMRAFLEKRKPQWQDE
ncbi:MAG: enoyl-CoA hydratase-related protein [Acidobacteriota bacterium]